MAKPVVHVVPTFHHDIAYLKPCGEYLPLCYDIILSALKLLKQDESYHFAIEQQFLWQAFWQTFPEQRATMRRFASEKRLTAAPGLYAVPDMNMTDGESLFMQATVGKRWLSEALGIVPTVCLIADGWGHHAQIPQIIAQCGYQSYIFSRCMRPDSRDVGENFLWEGIDGTCLRTHWLSDSYAGIRFPSVDAAFNAEEQKWLGLDVNKLKEEIDARLRFNGEDNVLLPNGGDMQMPQHSAPAALKGLNRSGVLPPLRFSSFEQYMDSVKWDGKPVVRGEFNMSQQGSLTTNIKIKQYNSRLVSRLLSLETAAVLAGRTALDTATVWPALLKGQFHDTLCGTLCDKALQDTLEEYAQAEHLLDQKQRLVETPAGVPMALNPLGFERTEVVGFGGKSYRVSLPAMSALPLAGLAPLQAADAPRTLPCVWENGWYTARIGADGTVTSLVERASGRELVAQRSYRGQAPVRFGEVHMQVDNGDNWNLFHAPWSAEPENQLMTHNYPDPYDRVALAEFRNVGPHRMQVTGARVVSETDGQLVVEQRGSIRFWITTAEITVTTTFSLHEPLIRYQTALLTESKHVRFRVAFPADVAQDGRVVHEIPFGWMERPRAEFAAAGFMDYADDTAGLALLNIGQPGNCVDEDGNLLLSLHRAVAMEYKCQSEASFQMGVPQRFEYAVVPHPGNAAQAWLCRLSQAYRQPPLVLRLDECDLISGFAAQAENVLITSVRFDGDSVFLRLYETAGVGAKTVLTVPNAFAAYAPADGLQCPAAPFAPCCGSIPLALRPHEIRGFLFRRGV